MQKVYVKVDENNYIIAVNSSVFLSDVSDWTPIDEGNGDKYAHAQGNYFDKPIIDTLNGTFNYKLVDGMPVEITDSEKVYPEPQVYIDPLSQVRADVDYIAIMTGVEL